MDTQARIKWIQSELDKVNDPELIELLANLLRYRNSTVREDIATYNVELEKANSRVEAGHFITHEQVEDDSKKW
ncbi:MAG: hypothetical protein ACK5V5_07955 [Cyclobacteriaceae bacterium]|jgi:hypothetical protein|nr:hypothetical protein [Flammeovirgaceae bacterium]